MKWSDTQRRVMLPARPVNKMNIVFDQHFTSQGIQVTLSHIDPAYAKTLGVSVGDIITSIDGTRPRGDAHALSLFDQKPTGGKDEHVCVFKTYGFHRYGKPILMIGAMVATTVAMLMYELQLGAGDNREL
eukprot:5794353-Prymnesium_polylepis.1